VLSLPLSVAQESTSYTNMHSFSTPSRRSFDLPKPDTGLAEWTSKIKAIQRQVDADEENEQKRLEEEIAAARQARLRRRSRGAGGDNPADSLDRCMYFSVRFIARVVELVI